MKFFFRTLGCKMNWLDTARVSAAIHESDHIIVDHQEEADVIVVNTCTVTAEADRKSHQIVNAAGRMQKQVAVIGCSPKVEEGPWHSAEGESLVFNHEDRFLEYLGIDPNRLPYPLTSRTRLPIAIQHGCDSPCSFCITRIARGSHHSVGSREVVDQIQRAQGHGIREVVLTGINLAAWGCSDTRRPEEGRLPQLLEQILVQTSIERIRLSSLGPEYLHPTFYEIYSDERLCAYLHLSVQSGSDSILESMRRGYRIEELYRIADQARAVRADTALACDMITGFPGEDEAAFAETVQFSREIAFARMHIFPYSARQGTEAATLPSQIDISDKRGRATRLREVARVLRREFIHSQIGKEHAVLIEGGGSGYTSNYIRVHIDHPLVGTIRTVRLDTEVIGEPL